MAEQHDFTPEMATSLKQFFFDFLPNVKIDSKDYGVISLDDIYTAQKMYLDTIFVGLQQDIHHFLFLKARQLGITTISLALDLFWVSYFPALQGAIIIDTEPNKEKFRTLITRMLESLPRAYAIPIVNHNTKGLVLANGSTLDYLVAGTRKNNKLGRSRAYNFVHGTECAFWGDQAGLESLDKSLSDRYPARLYIFESTANGYNTFHNMWTGAKEDQLTKKTCFIGWWAKEDYAYYPENNAKERQLFEKYSAAEISEDEQDLIDAVRSDYGVEVTLNQLAWYRHKQNPSVEDNDSDEVIDSTIEQELPWHEEQAFQMTGSGFFSPEAINAAAKVAIKLPFKGYRYYMGDDFLATTIEPVKNAKLAQLKIWEEPEPGSAYVIGADPAYGASEESDRYALQIYKVFADGLDQVAEFVSPTIKTYQFTWIIAHLCGLYQNARLLLEINGPGEAVLTEFRNLKTLLDNGLIRPRDDKQNIRNVLANVKNYLYHRADSLGGGYALQWKTNYSNKQVIMNQLRDVFTTGQITIRSIEMLAEMQKIIQDGPSIKGEGSAKDDRVIAGALSVRAWIDSERKRMQQQGLTRNAAKEAAELTPQESYRIFTGQIIEDFMARQRADKAYKARMASKGKRWNW